MGHQGLEALDALISAISEGLEHGYFKYSVICEMVKDRKRVLEIDAGKVYRFVIPEDQIHEVEASRLLGLGRHDEKNT
jgi:hypothetical protein